MTQPSVMQLGNTNGAVFRTKLNELLSAHTTDFAGPSAPAEPTANMIWQDTSVNPPLFRRRDAANSTWDLMGSWSNSVYSGSCVGSSGSTAKLGTPRTIATSGAATGSASFDGSANISIPLTLANSGAAAGTYGSATKVPVVVVNSKGLITSVSNVNITYPITSFNGRGNSVVLSTTDVLGVLPSKTGRKGEYLRVNSAETGVEWGQGVSAWTLVASGSGVSSINLSATLGNRSYLVAATYEGYTWWDRIDVVPSPAGLSPFSDYKYMSHGDITPGQFTYGVGYVYTVALGVNFDEGVTYKVYQ